MSNYRRDQRNSQWNGGGSSNNGNWRNSNNGRDNRRDSNGGGLDNRNNWRNQDNGGRNHQNGDWDRNDRRQQNRRDSRPQPYQTSRQNRRSQHDDNELTNQRFYGGNQSGSSYSNQSGYMDSAMTFLPPPPVPPMFGNGRRSFNDYSYDNSFSSTSTFRTSRGHNDTVVEMMQERDVITLSDEEHNEEGEIDDEDSNDEHKYLQAKLNEALGLRRNQVPEYILRMRQMGPYGYPPALIDEHVRSKNTLPFFGGTSETLLPKKTIIKESLPAFRGYTHLQGHEVSDSFFHLMQQISEIDHKNCYQDAVERSGIEEFKTTVEIRLEEEAATLKRKSEVIRYEIPEHEVIETKDYLFASETGSLKHSLDNFADGIQPFQNSHVNQPTGFLTKLKRILKKE